MIPIPEFVNPVEIATIVSSITISLIYKK